MEDDLEYYGSDNKSRIERCLACELPSCNNCLRYEPNPEGRHKKRAYRPRRKGGEDDPYHDPRQTNNKKEPLADRG